MPPTSVNKLYPLWHWLLTLALGSALGLLSGVFARYTPFSDPVSLYKMHVSFGLVYSVPTLAVYWVAFHPVVRAHRSRAAKSILNGIAGGGILFTMGFLFSALTPVLLYSAAYGLALVGVSCVLRLQKPTPAPLPRPPAGNEP